jgi:hypothetical protein
VPEGEKLDLGDGHWLTWRVDEPHLEVAQGRRIVAVVEHRSRTGKKCPVREFTLPGDVDRAHLTLEAELICPVCAERGFIQSGRWVRAPEPSGWDGQED